MRDKGVILLVEDNLGILDPTKRMLELVGYTVHPATTIGEARTILADVEPDVILQDVDLPDGNGMDFCRELRPQTKAHICLFTAERVRGKDLADCGADSVLRKPYLADDLIRLMERAAGDKREARRYPSILEGG